MMVALLLGSIAATEIEVYFLGLTPLLIIAVVAAGLFAGVCKGIARLPGKPTGFTRAVSWSMQSPRASRLMNRRACNQHQQTVLESASNTVRPCQSVT